MNALNKLTNKDLLLELAKRLDEKDSGNNDRQLMQQLLELNKKLQEAETMKSNFISNVTNEIVNPFTSIMGLAKNILSLKPENMDQAKSLASLIEAEAFNLDFQLKNIFAAAKYEAGQLIPEFSMVDIDSVLKNIVNDYLYRAEHKIIDIQIVYDIVSHVKDEDKKYYFITDSDKLKLIISNLLNNSLKYSQSGNKVIIKAKISEDDLCVSIQDFGIGMEKSNLEIIFDRFKRGNLEINSLIRGHGLGLSIVKASLDIVNGTITVKSRPNQGSTFVVTIPKPKDVESSDIFSKDADEFFFNEEEIF